MSQTTVYLNKEKLEKARKLAQKLGVSQYKLLALVIEIFFEDPAFVLYEIKHRLSISE